MKIKFFSRNDISIGLFLPEIKKILDSFITEPQEISSIESAIELQNVIKFIDNGIFSSEWEFEYIEKIKRVKKVLKQLVSRYLGTREIDEILGIMSSLDWYYYDDFFENFESFNYCERIPEADFEKAFLDSGISIQYLLKTQYFSRVYSIFMREHFLIDSLNIELLLNNFSDSNHEKLFFPDNITKDDWNILVDKYIDNPGSNLNYLRILENPIKNLDGRRYFNITPKQKLRIRRRSEEFSINMDVESSGLSVKTIVYVNREQYNNEVCQASMKNEMGLKETICRSVISNLMVSQQFSFVMSALIDKDQIAQSHRFEDLLRYFHDEYGFFSKRKISTLPSLPNKEMSTLMRVIGVKTDNSYEYDLYFETKQRLAILKIQAISMIIGEWDLRIEELIEWFFEIYSKEKYGVSWIPFDIPHSGESISNKISTLFRIEENIRKQFAVFLEEHVIDKDLVNETVTPLIGQLPSMLQQKYVYLSKNKTIHNITHHIFSDQSGLCYINENIKEEEFTSLITKYDLKIADFGEYNRLILQYLIDHDILEEVDEYLRFKNYLEIELLHEIYLFGSISFVHATDEEQYVLKDMNKKDYIIFSKTLFTKQESDYLNYLLNNKYFDNSLAIRNKYQHGAPNYDNKEQYESDYAISLLILILYIIKIDDEFKMKL